MSNINKAAVLNPFTDLADDVFKYIPRATPTEYGVVALGSGIKIDDLGRIQFDTKEVLDRFTVIEDQIQIIDENVTTAVDQVNNTLDTKADKTYVDNQLTFKANKSDVYTKSETYIKQESSDLVNNSISTSLIPVNTSLDLAKRGVVNRYDSSFTYNPGERVILANGDTVKSTVANNTIDPNVDMTGWISVGNNLTVSAIADMLNIPNPKSGLRIYVKSYFAGLSMGGGWFVYDSSKSSVNNGGTVINGWVREDNDLAIMPAWFGVRTDGTDDPLKPNHELLQVAVDAGYKSFDFGGGNNKYLFNGQVGLNSQSFYSTNAYRFSASGALVTLEGARSWITNIKVKNNGGVRGLSPDFTGKLLIHGFSFTGRNSEGVFDGDNIYNVIFSNNDCYRMKIISKSYAGNHPTYTEGYFQSVYLLNNHFSALDKILDGKRGFNITVSDNTFESCAAGIYIFGTGEPAISTIRIKDNAFEGGGLFLKLGDAMAGTISGNYMESNDQADTITEKCSILIDRSGGSYLANYTIENNMFSASAGQLSDPDYQDIKIVGYSNPNLRGVTIRGNWSSSIITKSPVRNMYRNTARDVSKGTGTAIDSFVDFNVARKSLSVSSNVSAGVLDVFWIDTVPNSHDRVDNQLTVKLSCIGSTSGGIELTRFFISFDFAIYSILVGGAASRMPVNTGVVVGNLNVMQQPESQIIDTVSSEGQKPMLISPTISVVSIGDRHIFKLSGFTATASSNYGSITNLDVYAEVTSFGGRSYKGINNLISYYK